MNSCDLRLSSCCRPERVRRVSDGGIVLGANDPGCCTLRPLREKITSSSVRCMYAHRKVGVDSC